GASSPPPPGQGGCREPGKPRPCRRARQPRRAHNGRRAAWAVSYLALSYLSCVLVFATSEPCCAGDWDLPAEGEPLGVCVGVGVGEGEVGGGLELAGELGAGLDGVGLKMVGVGDGCRAPGAGLDLGDGANVGWLARLDCGAAWRWDRGCARCTRCGDALLVGA